MIQTKDCGKLTIMDLFETGSCKCRSPSRVSIGGIMRRSKFDMLYVADGFELSRPRVYSEEC